MGKEKQKRLIKLAAEVQNTNEEQYLSYVRQIVAHSQNSNSRTVHIFKKELIAKLEHQIQILKKTELDESLLSQKLSALLDQYAHALPQQIQNYREENKSLFASKSSPSLFVPQKEEKSQSDHPLVALCKQLQKDTQNVIGFSFLKFFIGVTDQQIEQYEKEGLVPKCALEDGFNLFTGFLDGCNQFQIVWFENTAKLVAKMLKDNKAKHSPQKQELHGLNSADISDGELWMNFLMIIAGYHNQNSVRHSLAAMIVADVLNTMNASLRDAEPDQPVFFRQGQQLSNDAMMLQWLLESDGIPVKFISIQSGPTFTAEQLNELRPILNDTKDFPQWSHKAVKDGLFSQLTRDAVKQHPEDAGELLTACLKKLLSVDQLLAKFDTHSENTSSVSPTIARM